MGSGEFFVFIYTRSGQDLKFKVGVFSFFEVWLNQDSSDLFDCILSDKGVWLE